MSVRYLLNGQCLLKIFFNGFRPFSFYWRSEIVSYKLETWKGEYFDLIRAHLCGCVLCPLKAAASTNGVFVFVFVFVWLCVMSSKSCCLHQRRVCQKQNAFPTNIKPFPHLWHLWQLFKKNLLDLLLHQEGCSVTFLSLCNHRLPSLWTNFKKVNN